MVEVETPTASPFASSLLFDYVATYMYESDTPNAERRAAALALDRDLLRELLGQEELRDLIDPGALEQVEADLQRMSERTRADSADALHDVLRRLGDLTRGRAAPRASPRARTSTAGSTRSRGERRAIRVRLGGEPRWVAAEDAGLYRDALGAVPPGGLPGAFLADVPDAMERLARRWARTHGPFEARALRDRYGLDLTPVLAGAGARGRAGPRRAAARRHAARVVRPRGAAAAAARVARRAAGRDRARRPARARPLPAELAGRRPPPAGRRGDRPAARGCWSRCRASRCPRRCGSATCSRAAAAPTAPALARPAVRLGRGRVGRRRAARAPLRARSRSTSARTPRCSGRRRAGRQPGRVRGARRTPRSAPGWRRARASSPTCWSTSPASRARSCRRRCGISSGRAR